VLGLVLLGFLATNETTVSEHDVHVAVEVRGDAAVVTWLYPATPAWDAGVRPGDQIVALDDAPVDLLRAADQIRGAQRIEAVSATDGRRIVAEWDDPRTLRDQLNRFVFVVAALCFALIGVLVFLLSGKLAVSLTLLVFSTDTAVLMLASLATPFGSRWALALVLLSMLGFGFSALCLSLVLPVDQSRRRLAALVLTVTALASLAVASMYAISVLEPTLYPLVLRSMLLLVSVEALLAVAAVTNAWRTSPLDRPAVTLVILGLAGGFLPFVCLSVVPFLVSGTVLVPPEVAIVAIVLIPIALGALILRREFPGIERFVRRSILAFMVWAVLLALFGVAIHTVQLVLPAEAVAGLTPVAAIALVAVVAATFPLLQSGARRVLERSLFHDVYDLAPTIQAMTADLNRLRGVEAIARATLELVVEALDLRWACMLVNEQREQRGHRRFAYGVDKPPDSASEARIRVAAAKSVSLVTEEDVDVGMLAVGPKRHDVELLPDDERLLETIGHFLAPVLRNALLLEELAERVETLALREHELASLSLRVMRVQEEERRRIAVDLHDEPLQQAIQLLRAMAAATENGSPDGPTTTALIHRWTEDIGDVVVSLRAICGGLRPPTLDDFGLAVALETLAANVSARVENVDIHYDPPDDLLDVRLPPDLEVALYRAAQEGISNSFKHSSSRSIRLMLERSADGIELAVEDDGSVSPRPVSAAAVSPDVVSGGYGLAGIRERLAPWQGTVKLEHAERGTVLRVFVPLDPMVTGPAEEKHGASGF
jgi:two-component system sensor histidine kinase ComP